LEDLLPGRLWEVIMAASEDRQEEALVEDRQEGEYVNSRRDVLY
jgi:hypothetical protein